MKKLIYIILASLLIFSWASTESEIETVKDEISPLVEEVNEIETNSETEPLKVEENLIPEDNTPKTNLNSDIVPEEKIEENTENEDTKKEEIEEIIEEFTEETTDIEVENSDKETSLTQDLILTPENYDAPDYVEFLQIPNQKPEELEQIEVPDNLENQENNENQESFTDLDSIEVNENHSEGVFTDNQDFEDISYNQEIIEKPVEEDFVDSNTEETDSKITSQDNLISEEEDFSLNTDFIIDENDSEIVETPIMQENPSETENLLSTEESELITDLPETEDIPLEEIFTPDENFIPLEPEDTAEIEPTRSMDIKKNQILKVSFPGTGWLFLGDEYNSDTLSFDKRDIYETQTDFQLKSVQSGTALLHFFKQDMLTNEAINDYLLVTVNNRTGKWEVVDAPDYVFSSLEDEIIEYEEYYDSEYDDYYFIEDEPEVIVLEDNLYFVDDSISKKEIIDLANSFYEDDFYYETLDQLNYYFEVIGDSTDEYTDYALFLKGQLLEKQSPIRNIKESLAAYKKLVANFPDSKYWDLSKQRITYLERFYFNVR